MCWQEQWLKGLCGNRLEDFIERSQLVLFPIIFSLRTLENSFSFTVLCYWLFSIYFKISQNVKKIERGRTSWGGGRRFWNKTLFFLSVVSRIYDSSPEPSQAPRGILDQGFLAWTRFSKRQRCLWAISWNLKPSQSSLESERGKPALEHFVSHTCCHSFSLYNFLSLFFLLNNLACFY